MGKSILKYLWVTGLVLTCQLALARISPKEYIEFFDQDAVAEMLKSGVPASITLAQGMLESDYGNSKLAREAKNHFGIKCHSSWTGKRFYMDDDAKDECFRVYSSVYQSYQDHSDFLKRNRRYSFLFDLKRTDYKGWAKGLKKAGYATNPKYPDLLIRIIEENELWKFDKMDKNDLKKLGESSSGRSIYTDAPKKGDKTSGSGSGSSSTAQASAPKKWDTQIRTSKNKIRFVYAQNGDTPKKIADRYDLGHWQIKRYNELKKGSSLKAGTVIYLQPKRSKFKGDQKTHTVKKGQSLWDISQMYGIKLKKLAKRNQIESGTSLKVGQKIKLR
ncbi:glucosaminidase domain-containing protein [bacterium SCSIO 12741]|nr:glucosaminidase domain-containing protein [bacterium SCSIO 12741]